MPGPKMGVRPADFDEDLIRKAPTFQKWESLGLGQKLRYACREFTKGQGDDEERLMRRIMIARRNNLRDHEMLKKARELDPEHAQAIARGNPAISSKKVKGTKKKAASAASARKPKRRKNSHTEEKQDGTVEGESAIAEDGTAEDDGTAKEDGAIDKEYTSLADIDDGPSLEPDEMKPRAFSQGSASSNDDWILADMDENAVMTTRSYKTWSALLEGQEFSYNQKYIKGREGHDFLLKKNIWRRMRYRRENKKMVEKLKTETGLTPQSIPLKQVASTRQQRYALLPAPHSQQPSSPLAMPPLPSTDPDHFQLATQDLPILDTSAFQFIGGEHDHDDALGTSYALHDAAAAAAAAAAAVAAMGNVDWQAITNAAMAMTHEEAVGVDPTYFGGAWAGAIKNEGEIFLEESMLSTNAQENKEAIAEATYKTAPDVLFVGVTANSTTVADIPVSADAGAVHDGEPTSHSYNTLEGEAQGHIELELTPTEQDTTADDTDLDEDVASTWNLMDGSALDAAYRLAAATANVEEVAAAVAAATAGQQHVSAQTLEDATSAALGFQSRSESV